MASYTNKYNLKKPAQEDFYNVDDFNNNADTIDTALDAAQTKADSAYKLAEEAAAAGSATIVQANLDAHIANKTNPHGVTAAQAGAVPTSRTVNGKALSVDITLTASDVGADASGSATAVETNLTSHTSNTSNPHSVTTTQIGAVPTSRTVNSKALSANITLSASDVGASTVTTYTATLPTSGWTSSTLYYVSITVSGILATDTPIVDVVQSGTAATDKSRRESWENVTRIVTAANSITVYATAIPTVAVPIQLKVVR